MRFDGNGLEILERGECLALMGSVPVGRVVFTDRALPAIQPVNFVLDGEDVIIATAPGSKLAAATRGTIVAFEVDAFDVGDEVGWSVTVLGEARAVQDKWEIDGLSRLPLHSWIPGLHDRFVRIQSEVVTGRRIHPTMLEARP
ncbi:pyridoxamine 5'-phosphate oxidase family protein [Actinoallomurus purpureus]|uniref:pyridoxamine 5'-phosphate oxidase family protein n=1 Tax=Actinoallomurus purpureus TaxID=478114 RepID=UPI002093D362|nr:pyridoxamine 5'-phosphate oxidase family protein [Actinoallomurus purpureus]MCO6010026.1 pyridoxamine 5'-phosphate oxidase family protein [Actinoallomurus purpureus]